METPGSFSSLWDSARVLGPGPRNAVRPAYPMEASLRAAIT